MKYGIWSYKEGALAEAVTLSIAMIIARSLSEEVPGRVCVFTKGANSGELAAYANGQYAENSAARTELSAYLRGRGKS